MKEITAGQLALLLDIPKKEAAKKITVAIERGKGCSDMSIDQDKVLSNPSIQIDKLSKFLGVDVNLYLNDIRKNYLKNSSTGRWILNYPATKIKPSKETGLYPKTISIPGTLKSLLSEDQIREIIDKWNIIYSNEKEQFGFDFK